MLFRKWRKLSPSNPFDGLDYTRNALLEELALVERHARDGSAISAGCSCIEEKHLLNISGLASEGVTLTTDEAEKNYYLQLATWARERRREILDGDFKPNHGCEIKCLEAGHDPKECHVKCQHQ